MYSTLLPVHSFIRWLVLLSLFLIVIRAYYGKNGSFVFTKADNILRLVTLIIVHIQASIGLWLYIISPIVSYFLANFNTAIHEREIRFFGMEHITMMIMAVTLITIGSGKVKRKVTDAEKFKTIFLWFGVGLIIIFFSIPWAFSPFTARPYMRTF